MVGPEDARGGGDVAQGQADAAPLGAIGFRAVDDVRIVQGDAAGRHHHVDRGRFVHVLVQRRAQDVRRILGPPVLVEPSGPVRAGDHAHAAVLGRRVVSGQPDGDHLHRLQRPVVAVLVPEHRLPAARRLADVVGAEQGDVRSQERLDHVDQPGVCAQPDPERVVHDQVVVELLGPQVGMPALQPLHVALHLRHQLPVDHLRDHDVAVPLVPAADLTVRHGAMVRRARHALQRAAALH